MSSKKGKQVLNICREILSNPEIKLENNFFEFGDSLSAFILVSACSHEFGVEIDVSHLLQSSSLKDFVGKINTITNSNNH